MPLPDFSSPSSHARDAPLCTVTQAAHGGCTIQTKRGCTRFGAQALASRQTPDATPPIKRPSELGRVRRVGDVSDRECVAHPRHGCVCGVGERCVSALSRAHTCRLTARCLGNSVLIRGSGGCDTVTACPVRNCYCEALSAGGRSTRACRRADAPRVLPRVYLTLAFEDTQSHSTDFPRETAVHTTQSPPRGRRGGRRLAASDQARRGRRRAAGRLEGLHHLGGATG